MASPTSAPARPVARRSGFAALVAITLATVAAGWWLRGVQGAALGLALGLGVGVVAAMARQRGAKEAAAGTGTIEMKPGVASGSDARTRAAVMEGGVRSGVVPAGRSARGHRDRDL